jgi:hypothetical protein
MLQARQAKQISRLGGSAGVLVVAGLLLATCQAGELPCTKDDEWKAICAGSKASGGSGGGSGGSGGSTGGAGGSPSDAGGTGGKPATGALTKDTPIPNCSMYPTLGKMDDFFAMRCGVANGCHNEVGGSAWSNLKVTDAWMTLKNVTAKFSCKDDKLIDGTTWDKSVIWRKTRTPGPPMCAGSGLTMSIMPPPLLDPKMDALSADESTCLQNFLKAIAGTP